jgi:hypothetical protein
MNTHIKELIKQATVEVPLYYGPAGFSHTKKFNKEKFAELIVRECIEKCESVARDADFMAKSEFVTDSGRMLHEGMWGGATNCANELRTHFGIE